MIPVNQEIEDPIMGDCLRASAASLLELPLKDVPNFAGLFPENISDFGWFEMFYYWLWHKGYKVKGWFEFENIKGYDGIKGHAIVSVESLNYPDCTHACIYSLADERIVHDPNSGNLAIKLKSKIEGFYWIDNK